MRNRDILRKLQNVPDNTIEYINNQHYWEYPEILYDNETYPKGYVDVTTLKPDIIYKTPKYPEVELSSMSKIVLCCKNDDGTLLKLDDSDNMVGLFHKDDPTIFIMMKAENAILMIYVSNTRNYYFSLRKNDSGIWSINKLISNNPFPGSEYEYIPTTDYSPSTKKYVDDKAKELNSDIVKINMEESYLYTNNRFSIVNGIFKNIISYIKNPDSTSIATKAYINIDKNISEIHKFDHVFYIIKYKDKTNNEIIFKNSVTADYKNETIFIENFSDDNIIMQIKIIKDKQIDSSFNEIKVDGKCYISITISSSKPYVNNKSLFDNMEIEFYLRELGVLNVNNNLEYNPTNDYNPSTKKYVDDLINDNSLTNEELINTLIETEFSIPINIEIDPVMNNTLKEIIIKDKNYNIIYSKDNINITESTSINICISQDIMNNGIDINVIHTYGSLILLEMNGVELKKDTDYQYSRYIAGGDKGYDSIIDLKQVTGDIYMCIPGQPDPT